MSCAVITSHHHSNHNERQQSLVSSLMSTYAGETAANLNESLESVFSQTVSPDQLVLVVDGPIDEGQEEVIAQYASDPRIVVMTLVRLKSNSGLARAMNVGLEHCVGKYVMRADSDDICNSLRLALQLDYFEAHPEIDVVTSWCAEFASDDGPDQIKASPIQHDDIVRTLRWRNVLVHSSVLIRTETLRGVGGYRADFGMLEDYDLYIRLALSGARFHVIPKILVRMRTSIEQRRRRGGLGYCLKEIRFRFACLRGGFLKNSEFIIITLLYVVFRLIGGTLRQRLYSLARTTVVDG